MRFPGSVWRYAALAAAGAMLSAQEPAAGPPTMAYSAGTPIRVPFDCRVDRMEDLGLTCSEREPCVIFLELSTAQAAGTRVVVAGELHSEASTIESFLAVSEDGGASWTEPYPRIRFGSLTQAVFADAMTGWISGQVYQSLLKDPYFLVTRDGGKTWRRRPIYSESTVATIEDFKFEGPREGTVITAAGGRRQRWVTHNGGDVWQITETLDRKPAALGGVVESAYKVRTDARLKAQVVERKEGTRATTVAAFAVEAARCTGAAE